MARWQRRARRVADAPRRAGPSARLQEAGEPGERRRARRADPAASTGGHLRRGSGHSPAASFLLPSRRLRSLSLPRSPTSHRFLPPSPPPPSLPSSFPSSLFFVFFFFFF